MPVHDWFAQARQNGKSGFPLARTSSNGRSRIRLPLPKAERLYAGLMCEFRLMFANFRDTQVVEAEVRRQSRLNMPTVKWLGFRDIGPLREAWTPPLVVLGNWMKLREVERQYPGASRCSRHLLRRPLINAVRFETL